MNRRIALTKSSLLVVALGFVLPVFAESSGKVITILPPKKETPRATPTPTPTPTPVPTPTPAAPAEPKIPGTVIPRANGAFLSLQVVDGKFLLSFYDAKKQPVKPDVPRAMARWNPQTKLGEDRTVLNPTEDGLALRGTTFVRPPYNYAIFVTLLPASGEATETFRVRYTP